MRVTKKFSRYLAGVIGKMAQALDEGVRFKVYVKNANHTRDPKYELSAI